MHDLDRNVFATSAYAVDSLAGIGMLVATVVVVRMLAQRYRPASARLLLGWAIATLVWGLVRSAIGVAVPYVVARFAGGIETFLNAQAAMLLLNAFMNVALGVVFLVGLGRVMRDDRPRMENREIDRARVENAAGRVS